MGLLLLFLLGFQFCQFIDTNSKLKCSHEDQIKVQRTMIPFVKKKKGKKEPKTLAVTTAKSSLVTCSCISNGQK